MASGIIEYLAGKAPGPFRPVPHYFPSGDYLTYYVSDERCRARRIDDFLTVYLAEGSDQLVGCKIKGVRHILKEAGSFGCGLDDADGVRLGLFFFKGVPPERGDTVSLMKWYNLLKEWADVRVTRDELLPARSF
jgi:hypothetical protein